MFKTELKLFIWRIIPMEKHSVKQWAKKLRRYVKKEVYIPFLRIDVPVTEIDTKEKLVQFVFDSCGPGTWVVRGMSHGRTRVHLKWVRICKVIIIGRGDQFTYRLSDHHRYARYWFVKEGKKDEE